MVKIFLLIFVFCFSNLIAQQSKEWIEKLENPEFSSEQLKAENVKEKYIKFDFSTLLIPRHDFLGYIGSNYKRIRIYFTSISKDQEQNDIYNIIGISVVDDNKCDFSGKIKIDQIREYKHMDYGLDNHLINSGMKAQGVLIGKYLFDENPTQSHSGVFEGIMTLFWYLDKFDIVHYDEIDIYSDDYKNNQYIGTWTEYKKQNGKICNWGEYRIPFSDDLDIGTGEFSPNPKYKEQGWADLIYY